MFIKVGDVSIPGPSTLCKHQWYLEPNALMLIGPQALPCCGQFVFLCKPLSALFLRISQGTKFFFGLGNFCQLTYRNIQLKDLA